jgi:hypothetical protein
VNLSLVLEPIMNVTPFALRGGRVADFMTASSRIASAMQRPRVAPVAFRGHLTAGNSRKYLLA